MATLILQSVGSAIAGPLGNAIGASLGFAIDETFLGPGARRGPRLGDLTVQGSSYGSPIPKIFGSMRIAGTLIWSTDLVESETVTGAKGQPDVITYNYSASFAVALSARSASRIGRIWADGRLLRGEAGDLKVGGELRFWSGHEDQLADPLIESIEGAAPAYRGIALAIFENLELGEFGNRIPILTFEVIADEASLSLGEVLSASTDATVSSTAGEEVAGYAFHGETERSALAPLATVFQREFCQEAGLIIDRSEDPAIVEIVDSMIVSELHSDSAEYGRRRTKAPLATMPKSLSLDHYDPSRDYQAGRALAEGDRDARENRKVDAPVVMASDVARSRAERMLLREYCRRERIELRLVPAATTLRPGDVIRFEGSFWRLDSVQHEEGAVVVTGAMETLQGPIPLTLSSDSGAANVAADILLSPTQLALFDLPDLGGGPRAEMYLAAASASTGWRAVPVEVEVAGQVRSQSSAGRETILGWAETALLPASFHLPDLQNEVIVQLVDKDQWLEPAGDDALLTGANLAVLGDELFQFGSASPLGDGRFRLSGLLRGLRGSDWAMDSHLPGDAFALLNANRMTSVSLAREQVGALVSATPYGLADDEASKVGKAYLGEALRPPSPTNLMANMNADGSLAIAWTPRSRLAWGWTDGIDPGPGETQLIFRVGLSAGVTSNIFESTDNYVTVPSGDLQQFVGQAVTVTVEARGDYAASHPRSISLNL